MASPVNGAGRKGNTRRHTRYPLEGKMRVLWRDASGRDRVSTGNLMDVSVSGIRLRLDDQIPARTYLTCNEPKLGIAGSGCVRYSQFVRGKYEIGVEFSGGTGWREPVPATDHSAE